MFYTKRKMMYLPCIWRRYKWLAPFNIHIIEIEGGWNHIGIYDYFFKNGFYVTKGHSNGLRGAIQANHWKSPMV
jgi:hypothetical protein